MRNNYPYKWLIAAVSALIGIVASYVHMQALLAVVLLVGWLLYKKQTRTMYGCAVLVLLCAYSYSEYVQWTLTKPVTHEQLLTWSGRYTISGDTLRGFATNTERQKLYVMYEFTTAQEKTQFENEGLAGRQFYAQGELVAPREPNHQYGFQMDAYIRSQRAQGVYEVISWQEQTSKQTLVQFLDKWRLTLNQYIDNKFPQSLAPEAKALLFGDQQETEEEAQRAYLALGITHLFAISGLHIALLAWGLYAICVRCGMRKEIAHIMLLIMLPVYGVLAGGAPSVWRAVSFVEIALLLQFLRKPIPLSSIICISFLGYVLVNPGVVFQIGFQLSYLASLALLYSGAILQRSSNFWMQSFLVTVVCQLLTYPLLLHHFFTLSLSSFFVNVIFVPLFSFIILPINVLFFVLPEFLSDRLFPLYETPRVLLQQFIYWLGSLPYQQWVSGRPALGLCVLAYVSVFMTFVAIERRVRWRKIAVILFVPVLCIEVMSVLSVRHVTLHFINVGQGDAVLIELPYREKVILVDAGGVLRFNEEDWQRGRDFEVGREIVVPYIKGLGIATIDTLVLTHADADHIEGAEEILEELRVKDVHISPNMWQEETMQHVAETVKEQRIVLHEKIAGDKWGTKDVLLQYVSPQDTVYEGNDDSLVLLLQTKWHKVLLTGDVEASGEAELVKDYGQTLSGLTLLKAGHHGSKTSSTEAFIQATMPRVVIFSAGKDNRYGHPHNDVVARFQAIDAYMWQTGEQGTLKVTLTPHVQLLKQ